MFDKNSDYALNKRDKDSIAYISATGAPVLLTRADFSNEDEFLQWKLWSDGDYKSTEQDGRGFYDNCISLNESLDCIGAVASIEDEFFSRLDEPERIRARADLSQKIRDTLTEKQYRRLWMICINGMTERAVADIESVSQQRISMNVLTAKRRLKKISEKNPVTPL